jgi:peptide deformylase
MALRQIIQTGDEMLGKVARPVEVFDDKLRDLLDDMQDTLKKADGVGLAAPQVGILKRAAIVDIGAVSGTVDDMGYLEMINPEVTNLQGEQRDIEGCLSCPDQWGYVVRAEKCTLKAQNRYGEEYTVDLEGLACRCVLHENDHLNGKLFVEFVDEFVDKEEVAEKRNPDSRKKKRAKKVS